MFEFVRTHQRLMQFVLMLFIFPSFAFVGIQSYSRFGDSENTVAKVGGQSITQQELDAAHRKQLERLREMAGGQVDPQMFDTPEAKQRVLDTLIAQHAMAAEAVRLHLNPTENQIQAAILSYFPSLANPALSKDERIKLYNDLANAQGMSVESLQYQVAQSLMLQNVNGAIESTGFAPKSVLKQLTDIVDQEREVQELAFKTADYASQVKITDGMLKDYYDKNAAQFKIPDQAKAEYVVLSLDALAARETVSDAEVSAFYKQNEKRFIVDEQRRASHILIAVKKDASDADKAAAKAKAEKILTQLRKNPHEFAKLAKENSQDPGSAERGGDLDYFGKGMMVKPFEDVAFKLKQNEISDPVQSDFGYHIIQLTGIKPAAIKPLEEVKAEIVAELQKQQATKKFAAAAETFTNTVYEQADSLKPAADKLKLKIETIAALTRQPNPQTGPNASPVNNPKFLKALFSDDVIKNKRNTEAIETAPNVMIAGRILEYKSAAQRPFEEVRGIVHERVMQAETERLAKKAGEDKLAALKAKDDATGFASSKMVSRAKSEGMDNAAFAAVMKADIAKLPAYVGAELPGRGYNIYRINRVAQAASVDQARRDAEQQQVAGILAQQDTAAYVDALKQKAKVKILKPVKMASAPTEGSE